MADLGDNKNLQFLLWFEVFKLKAAMVVLVVSVLGIVACLTFLTHSSNVEREAQNNRMLAAPAHYYMGKWCKDTLHDYQCKDHAW